ncbi:AAA family ATPase [Paenibacillus frigoriresistens]|nr:AAA family ATPase [Paenibacillus frigoriresistens]
MQTLDTLNDLSAEQAYLGAVLIEPNCLDITEFLETRDFSERHQLIYRVLRYMRENEKPVDLITVADEFVKYGRLEIIGGVSYLSDLASACATTANVTYYAEIIRRKGVLRRGRDAGEKLIQAATEGDYSTDEEFYAAAEEIVDDIRPKKVSKMRSFKETKKEYYEHIKSKAEKILSGFKQFDEWAQLWRGWLYIIAGRPGAGKTAKALQLAIGIARQRKEVNGQFVNAMDAGCVMIYSQEMDENELKDRMVANIAGVNYNRLINKGGPEGFTEREQEKIDAAYEELESLPIFIDDSPGISFDKIRSDARQMKKQHGKIAAIIVDYLQIMDIQLKKNEKRHEAIGRITTNGKTLARKEKLVFIMLSQMSRDSENRDKPQLSDLKDSGNIEQDADVVEFLWDNGEKDNNTKVVNSIFAKGRNIGLNSFRYRFEWWLQRYVELDKDKEPEKKKAAGRK